VNGLEQLQQAFAHGGTGSRPGIASLLGMDVERLEEGTVAFGLATRTDMSNPIGTVHGGIAATLLDSAMACAVHSTLGEHEGYTTLDLHVHYTRPIRPDGGRVVATGSVVHRGSRVATAEGRLLAEDGKLLAHGSTTCMVFPAP
jgi:uncharacterized protein (TIGR00369 family)